MRPLDVGIVGGGTAGTAAAVFLARAGHRITLYERVADPMPVGAGITLQPTGLHVLRRLRLSEDILSRGSRIDRLFCQTRTRRPLVDLSYRSVSPTLFGVGLHRGVLFEALFNACRAERITVVTGVEIASLPRAVRTASRESWLLDTDGRRHGPHELVVVADGARSRLRDRADLNKRVSAYPWGALWFVAKETREASTTNVLHQIVDGNERFVGLLPTGHGPGPDPGPRLVSLFWSLRADRVGVWRARGLAAWKDEVAQLAPEAGPILDQIESADQVLFAAYHDVVMPRWSTRNVVYLGDAAHATSPQLGQGCNLALWDAMVLADALAVERFDLPTALDNYSRTRAPHLGFYQVATRMLTPWFQGDEPVLGTMRDLAMPLLGRVRLPNRIMTLTMLGVVDGFTGRLLELDLPELPPTLGPLVPD